MTAKRRKQKQQRRERKRRQGDTSSGPVALDDDSFDRPDDMLVVRNADGVPIMMTNMVAEDGQPSEWTRRAWEFTERKRTDHPVYQEQETVIGFSILELYEDCFEYVENACFIASTRASAVNFMRSAWGEDGMNGCRTVPVRFVDVIEDFGCSIEYALEPEAYARFKRIADLNGIEFHSTELDDNLIEVITNAAYVDDWDD